LNLLHGTVSYLYITLIVDYGESHYVGPIHGALPAGSCQWVNGFDHTPWQSLLSYFISAYKSGNTSFENVQVTASDESVVFWYRSHSKNAIASCYEEYSPPSGAIWADDNVQVVAILASPATVVIQSGTKSQSFSAHMGLNFLTLEGFKEGQQTIQVIREGKPKWCGVGSIPINNSIDKYNFNAVVGRATSGGCTEIDRMETKQMLIQKFGHL
jgi:glucan endo-1,3-alpha-glucosidase